MANIVGAHYRHYKASCCGNVVIIDNPKDKIEGAKCGACGKEGVSYSVISNPLPPIKAPSVIITPAQAGVTPANTKVVTPSTTTK